MNMITPIAQYGLGVLFIILSQVCYGKMELKRIDPPFWWAGMQHSSLQLLVYGKELAGSSVEFEYEGVELASTTSVPNPNYLFIDLILSPNVKPGKFELRLVHPKEGTVSYEYELKARIKDRSRHKGLTPGDVMYLIMPDRYSNGNPKNDEVAGMKEKPDRGFHGGRHGGDIQGIVNHLDYMKDLGITTVWVNPFLENDMPAWSYHGYAITDHYKSDPRYGTNEEYANFVKECHKRGLKVVMDQVFNHCGSEHWWMKDLPMENWVHQFDEFTRTNYNAGTSSDPYASDYDSTLLVDGWFDVTMPDMNQRNPYLLTYLIQNSVWWIEYAGINGIRMDTYPYPDKEAMVEWVDYVLAEYPDFYLVGETWLHAPAYEGYWQGGGPFTHMGYDSHIPSVSDFPTCFGIVKGLRGENDGLYGLYEVIASDIVYANPYHNKIFADNHDLNRLFHEIGRDMKRFKMALAFILTTRGIPQIFYGTEIAMAGSGEHGVIREDFPGGWEDDKRNAFEEAGRTELENEAFNYLRGVLNWRKTSEAIEKGRLKHFIPQEEMYVYSRYTENDAVIVVLNNGEKEQTLIPKRYSELWKGYRSGKEIISGKTLSDLNNIKVPAGSTMIIDLQ